MSRRGEELEAMRRDGLSERVRQDFRASAEVAEAWDRAHPLDVDAVLGWIEELRQVFGDPPLDRRPWRGNDFRL
jgi:hypothetical protein